ncbi:SDR family NAD(P)-dependent oxidoreductase [Pseudomonas sp. UBA6562]|uniref:SDR family NAD(P)-dependent oxidoreductase n=1 Tax=Pseudomonas sp. UBA6562 TaxID=1947332 RepID=UPI0025E4D660|nr:SDR family NAD(P)-dependent oxidoreductase [Pseudomonas sp. UBA6562]
MLRFHDKVVLITGAAAGIGEATARRFAEEGAQVVLADWNLAKAQAVAAELPAERVLAVQVDVSDLASVQRMVEATVARFGGLDVLVNNAGVHIPGTTLETSEADWRKIASVNIDGVIFCSKLALPHLIERRGNIVSTASVSGLGGDWGAAFYCASKGAVVNYTRALALDHGAQGVRANAVCPSLTRTAMTWSWEQSIRDRFNERIPLQREALPSEVAAAIAFLASDDASFVNGVNLPVDGGVTASDGQPKVS